MTSNGHVRESWGDVVAEYGVRETLVADRSEFQDLRIVDTDRFGRMLVLDGFVQTTERDEFAYHEMMTHPALLACGDPRRVLVIGGGDGGILREVLRHPSVERAVLVEIDASVIDLSRRYLPMICRDSFDDPRVEIILADGAEYLGDGDERFDAIIVDSPDPIGPAQTLFTEGFYRDAAGRLTDRGVMTRQTGSTYMQPDEQADCLRRARGAFRHPYLYVFTVPT